MKKQIPTLKTDAEAEQFVATADLSNYDLTGLRPVRFQAEGSLTFQRHASNSTVTSFQVTVDRARELGHPFLRRFLLNSNLPRSPKKRQQSGNRLQGNTDIVRV